MQNITGKTTRNSIVTGIISSIIFLYFLEPLFNLLGKTILILYKTISTTLYDRLFQEMAIGKPDYGYTLFSSLCLLSFIILYISFLRIFIRKRKVLALSESGMESEVTEPNLENKSTSSNLNVYFDYFNGFLVIATFILLLVSLVLSDIKLKTIQTFEQQIRIISPYIETQNKEIIISDFSRMQNSKDFDNIKKTIDSIATKNNIELPVTRRHLF